MEKKLSKKTLTKSFHNWYYGNLTCFSQEHMQTFGYLCSMLPIVEELYDKKDARAKAIKTYTAFFNTEPQVGSVIVGMTAGLEEARANGAEDVDDETINGLRAGLMGPFSRNRRYFSSWNDNSYFIRGCNGNVYRWFTIRGYFLYYCLEFICLFWNEVIIF